MDRQQQDKTNWNAVVTQPDEITTSKAKLDPDAPILDKYNYKKPSKKSD